jgi:hypothetical protein
MEKTLLKAAKVMDGYTKEDLEEALRAIVSTISKCEKVQPRLKQGTSQHTLLIRRIKALNIASALIRRELSSMKASPDLSSPTSQSRVGQVPRA